MKLPVLVQKQSAFARHRHQHILRAARLQPGGAITYFRFALQGPAEHLAQLQMVWLYQERAVRQSPGQKRFFRIHHSTHTARPQAGQNTLVNICRHVGGHTARQH